MRRDLVVDEGMRLTVYKDLLGIDTIGVGRNLRDKGITEAEALRLLDHDIDECLQDLMMFPWFVRLDGVRQIALVNLRFNLGRAGFRGFHKMIAALAASDHARAATELLMSKWSTQVAPARRDRLVAMVKTGTLAS